MSEQIQKVVEWCIVKRRVIKFQGEENSIKVEEKTDLPMLRKGNNVVVEIKNVDGKDVVSAISKVDAVEEVEVKQEVKKEEPKAEQKVEEKVVEKPKEVVKSEEKVVEQKVEVKEEKPVETKTLTIANVWTNKIVFKESPINGIKWFTLDEKYGKTQEELIKNGYTANTQVEAGLQENKIVEIKILAKPETKKEEKKQESRQTSSFDMSTNESIMRQVAVKEADILIAALINVQSEAINSVEKIKTLQKELTKNALQAMKEA